MHVFAKAQGMLFSDQVILTKLRELLDQGERPTQEMIAAATGAHIITVKRATRRLVNSGHIARVRTASGYEYRVCDGQDA